jgi:hypothetical protein
MSTKGKKPSHETALLKCLVYHEVSPADVDAEGEGLL